MKNKKMLSVLAALTMMVVFMFGQAVFSQTPEVRTSASVSAKAVPPHPLINRAIGALETAKAELQDAAHQYCGHRAEALSAVDAALHQLHLAIECQDSRADSTGDLTVDSQVVSVSTAGAPPHPRISAAINALQNARNNLADAAHVYCGHRAEALSATDAALHQLHAAIECQNW